MMMMLDSHDNKAMSTAILNMALCVCDIMNKADVCGGV